MFKKEVEILSIQVVFENSNDSEWGDQYFAQPKHKTNKVIFLSDIRDLNHQLNVNYIQCLRSMKYY